MLHLNALHTKRLMVNFESDEVKQERDIEAATGETTQLFRHAESLLKEFSAQTDKHDGTVQEKVVRNNIQRSIAKKLQGLSSTFRTSQKVPYLRIHCKQIHLKLLELHTLVDSLSFRRIPVPNRNSLVYLATV